VGVAAAIDAADRASSFKYRSHASAATLRGLEG
jgi:hypothetical protein